jgi:hypothetical protein
MQFFNTVITPSGIFRCPAFRGVDQAKIASCEGYTSQPHFKKTAQNLSREIQNYDSHEECKVVACFYNHVNWWVENIITSPDAPDSLPVAQDDNFFL